jgi:hypothetical protein
MSPGQSVIIAVFHIAWPFVCFAPITIIASIGRNPRRGVSGEHAANSLQQASEAVARNHV